MSENNIGCLAGLEWAQLLCAQPQFADRCDWSALDGNAWHCLLCKQPQFADQCDWSFVDDWNKQASPGSCRQSRWYWVTLLIMQPQFADKCDIWADIKDSVSRWRGVARACTDLFICRRGTNHRSMSNKQNDIISEKPDGTIQALILKMDPSGASLPGFDHFKGDDWAVFLSSIQSIPDFILQQCPWTKLNGGNWASLLANKPELADKCIWTKLDGGNWAELLGKQPQFADKCDWAKFGKNEDFWYSLLCCKPEFKDKFESLTGRKYDEDDFDEWLTNQLW